MSSKTEPALRELLPSRGDRKKTSPTAGKEILFSPTGMATELMSTLMKLDQPGTDLYGVEYRREHLTGKGSIDG